MKLAADFSSVSAEEWRASVDKALGGRDFEKSLVSNLYEGFSTQPIYRKDDNQAGPGLADFVDASRLRNRVENGWDVRQRISEPDVSAANRQILEELERGSVSVTLKLRGTDGIDVKSTDDLDEVLRGVLLDMACVALDAGADFKAAAYQYLDVVQQRGLPDNKAMGHLNCDPIAAVARNGATDAQLEAGLSDMADIAGQVSARYPNMRSVSVDTSAMYEAGLNEAQDLSLSIATGLCYLKHLVEAGLTIDAAADQIVFVMPIGVDQFLSIAKLRAARRLWARVVAASGGAENSAVIYAEMTGRVMSRQDPWVNMLRATVAAFAGATGGADGITIPPYDAAIGLPDDFSRRIARNTQVVLSEESSLSRVSDPSAGSWYVEDLTEKLAQAAWECFQSIEAAGGIAAALKSGLIHEMAAASWAARAKNIAKRKDAITGVSEFPNIAEEAPKSTQSPAGAASSEDSSLSIQPFPSHRFAEGFEELRAASSEQGGDQPAIFIANIGTPADYTARTTFARNFFEAGGIAGHPSEVDADNIAEKFRASGARLAILCSSDKLYGESGAALASTLKAAGAEVVYLAGRGGDLEETLTTAGVDRFVFAGCDALGELRQAARHLGVIGNE